ncbi:hypothetical protein THIAE_02735 [Thiomicrospira aerophila AL3]|uniref:Uncharacterized protein n=1 Tax=Thiomicrospira aerophila AL3 TaxID=717772 RepID=W0DUV0_9GAMM|nr:hypothetical protein THIAE_02735 [Thiomicrospira aerophila AL3]
MNKIVIETFNEFRRFGSAVSLLISLLLTNY